jgi:hypothetical protein
MAEVTLPDGSVREVALPVAVRRADSMVVSWLVSLDAARRVLQTSHPAAAAHLEPVPMLGGRTMVAMPFVRYVDGDLGAYNELGLAFVVRRIGGDPKDVGSYIAHLPVDGEFTCAAGRQLWGFPKMVADELVIERDGRGGRVHLESGDGTMVDALLGRGLVPLPARTMDTTTYAACDGTLLETAFTMRTEGLRLRPGGRPLRVEGDGPLARDALALGLDRRRPVSTLWVSALTGEFAASSPVADPVPATTASP